MYSDQRQSIADLTNNPSCGRIAGLCADLLDLGIGENVRTLQCAFNGIEFQPLGEKEPQEQSPVFSSYVVHSPIVMLLCHTVRNGDDCQPAIAYSGPSIHTQLLGIN